VNEREAIDYVESRAILGMRFGLERMRELLRRLGDPQRRQPSVHIVGTNGKTSTTRLTAAALRSQGLVVGAYVSPHVIGWNERIEVDGHAVDGERFAAAIERVRDSASGLDGEGVTQFEVLTAAAFVVVAEAKVDVVVVEAGLGGRYDATNVLPRAAVRSPSGRLSARPVVCLTNVSRDHTDLLGEDEASITAEKLAVCPDGFDRLRVGRLSPAAATAVDIEMGRRDLHAAIYGRDITVDVREDGLHVRTPIGTYGPLTLGIEGQFQHDNLALALAAADCVLGRPLEVESLRDALRAVRVPGRMERFPGQPEVMLDGAHNPAGIAALVESLDEPAERRIVVVMSVLDDKDLPAMVGPIAGRASTIIATRSHHARAIDPSLVATQVSALGGRCVIEPDPTAALDLARHVAGAAGLVLVCGSLYLLGDLRRRLQIGDGAGASIPSILGEIDFAV
jgi:dihydrofolate synthase / folylpolyglutamate synthase